MLNTEQKIELLECLYGITFIEINKKAGIKGFNDPVAHRALFLLAGKYENFCRKQVKNSAYKNGLIEVFFSLHELLNDFYEDLMCKSFAEIYEYKDDIVEPWLRSTEWFSTFAIRIEEVENRCFDDFHSKVVFVAGERIYKGRAWLNLYKYPEIRKFAVLCSLCSMLVLRFSLLEENNKSLNFLCKSFTYHGETMAKIDNTILKKYNAKTGAIVKRSKDPKQRAKEEIKEEYLEWQAMPEKERNAKYRSAAKFASVMRDTQTDKKSGLPYFDSPRVIERWCTEWKKELKNTHPA